MAKPSPAALPSGKKPGTHFIGGLTDPRAGLDCRGKSRLYGDLNPGSSIPHIRVSQPLGHGPVRGPGINYTGPREVLLEFVIYFSKQFS